MNIYFQESCTSVCANIVIFTQEYMFWNKQRRECLNPTNSKKIIANRYLGLITVPKVHAKKNIIVNIEEFGQSWQQWLLKAAPGLIPVKLHSVTWSFHEQDLNGGPALSL